MISRFTISSLVWVLLASFSMKGMAQDDCVVKLNEAEKLYEEGKIEKIPEMLNSCIDTGFNKENKIAALRLLTLVYLFDDNLVKAENSLLRLLKEDPEYKTNQAIDPVEFTRLYNSFNTAPILSIGIVLGTNQSKPRLIDDYSTYNISSTDYSANGLGFSVGLRGVYHINNLIDIILEPSLTTYSYSLKERSSEANITLADESMTFIDFPIFVSYVFYKYTNWSIYGEAGSIYGMYLSSDFNGNLTYINNENPNYQGPSVSSKEIRMDYLAMGSLGVGAKFKINRGNIAMNIRYKFGFNNIVNPKNRYYNIGNLYNDYMHIDDDYSISNFCISISYNYEFYTHHKKPTNKSNYDVLK